MDKNQDKQLRSKLTPLQYQVAIQGGTERPFDNEYNANFDKGIYVDIVSGRPLFVSTDKFESGCGWPAFAKPIEQSCLVTKRDTSHGMIRTEVRSQDDTHLGHVFDDGPKSMGGLRYCINSASLKFVPYQELDNQGYSQLKSIFE
jgi:methionine-R-sulfoxide reductase